MIRPTIKRGGTEIEVPGAGFVAVHPFHGPANSKSLIAQIRGSPEEPTDLVEPTSRQVAVFANSLFGGKEREEKELTEIMKNNYLRAFTGILYDPRTQLVYFVDYPEFDEDSIVRTDRLVERVSESYAQIPFRNLREEAVEWNKVAKHLYFRAWAGEEGAEALAELASRHPTKEAYVWVPKVSDFKRSEARAATLNSDWNGDRLNVYARGLGSNESSYAFGVRAPTGAVKKFDKVDARKN